MKINEILSSKGRTLSFEVFPPKTWQSLESVMASTAAMADLKPDYMSVTFGAGGGTSEYTAAIASHILNMGVTPLAHLTCISLDRSGVHRLLTDLRGRGIENILALRGDIPEGLDRGRAEYKFASDLISEIRDFGGFSIGGACYPEGHPESPTREADIAALRHKVASGCQFLTTQMFFDNAALYRFREELLRVGVTVPIVAGIMPITSAAQVEKMIKFSGHALPKALTEIIEKYGADPNSMREAGIDYATRQIADLYENGQNYAHVYTMNKPETAAKIRRNLWEYLDI